MCQSWAVDALDRLLSLACRDLDGERAWLEYASAPPPAERTVSADLERGWRLVVALAETPDEAARASKTAQLVQLARGFRAVADDVVEQAPTLPLSRAPSELQTILDALAERTAATVLWVIDDRSPVVWGSTSAGAWLEDAGLARRLGGALLGLSPQQALHWLGGQQLPPAPPPLAACLPELRDALGDLSEDDAAFRIASYAAIGEGTSSSKAWSARLGDTPAMSRPFAGIYRLVALFDPAYSELHAQTTITRALPIIERLVAEHPPIDPTPQGAQVHAFRRPE